MERLAYGPLALKPWEFEKLTPAEFNQMVDGYRRRQETAEDTMAWALSLLLSPYSKTKIRPSMLLDRPSVAEREQVRWKKKYEPEKDQE